MINGIKRLLKGMFLSFLFCNMLMVSVASVARADWVKEWLDSALIEGPSAVEGATRHYYSLGGAYIRLQTGHLRPISITPPRVSIGCGGIDAFWGAFSVLDFDYAVERLKRIMYAAAPFAFQYALGRLCEKCKQIINAIESSANLLNQISLDQCAAGKAVAAYLVNSAFPPKESKGNEEAKLSKAFGVTESFWDYVKDFWGRVSTGTAEAKPDEQITERQDDACPGVFKDMFKSGKRISMLHVLVKKGVIKQEFEDLIRGMVGDIIIAAGSAQEGGGIAAFHYYGCQQEFIAEDIVQAFLQNRVYICTIDEIEKNGQCSCCDQKECLFQEGKTIQDYVNNKLSTYIDNLVHRKQPDNEIVKFMEIIMKYSWQFPVYGVIKQAYTMDIPIYTLASPGSIVSSCAAVIYTRALIENILAFAGYMKVAKLELTHVCNQAKSADRCILCSSKFLNSFNEVLKEFMKEVDRVHKRYSLALDKAVQKRCQQVLALSANMQQLDRASAKWAFAWTVSGQ